MEGLEQEGQAQHPRYGEDDHVEQDHEGIGGRAHREEGDGQSAGYEDCDRPQIAKKPSKGLLIYLLKSTVRPESVSGA